MKDFVRCLHADFIKVRRRPVFWVHILVPLIGIIFLLLNCALSKHSPGSDALSCLGAIAVTFPTLIGIVCSMIADQEAEAGNYQWLLKAPFKLRPFQSISVLLLLLGLGATLFTAFGFEVGFYVILHRMPFGPDFYLFGALLVFGSNVFLYFLHLFLSLRFNKGISIGVGIVESLLSALLITGLGDGKWIFIPCAWGLRFLKMYGTCSLDGAIPASYGLQTGIAFCLIETILMFIISFVWFICWEGKKTEE